VCTVSVIRLPGDVIRLACNRDELLSRPIAQAPRELEFGEARAILPVDPASGGTWIAVNDAGLVFTLLNRNARRLRNPHTISPEYRGKGEMSSRGLIIPSLLHCRDFEEAINEAARVDPRQFEPFRLIVASRSSIAEIISDGSSLSHRAIRTGQLPLLFTSSGLGDELVEHPRRMLFDRIIRASASSARAQDGFHHHSWPNRRRLSVWMRRGDARTVSFTTITLRLDRAMLAYNADSLRTSHQLLLRGMSLT